LLKQLQLLLLHVAAGPVLAGDLRREELLLLGAELLRVILRQRALPLLLLLLLTLHSACGRSHNSTRELASLELHGPVGAVPSPTPLLLHLLQELLKRQSRGTAGACWRLL